MPAVDANIREDIRQQVNGCLRRGDKERLGVLRIISSEIGILEIDKKEPINQTDFVQLLIRLRKQHQASMDQFKDAGREDLYNQEATEKAIVESLLPEQLSGGERDKIITAGIQASNATSPKDIGKVMAQVKEELLGKADMGEVSKVIKEKLSS